MKLQFRSFDFTFFGIFLLCTVLISVLFFQRIYPSLIPYAHAEHVDRAPNSSGQHFIVLYDGEKQLQFKTSAGTVGEALKRAKVETSNLDIVEPDLHAEITSEKFYINIYRARPVLVIDGAKQKIIETASFDEENIIKMSGFVLFDNDSVKLSHEKNLMLSGVSAVYKINRSGDSTLTTELSLPADEERRIDKTLKKGETKLIDAGEDGRKIIKYRIEKDQTGAENRKVIEEKVVAEPKKRIIAVNDSSTLNSASPETSKTEQKAATSESTPNKAKSPTANQPTPKPQPVVPKIRLDSTSAVTDPNGVCAGYARAAGVSEADLPYALDLIKKESNCNPSSTNRYSGAYGIPQALPGSKMAEAGADWQTNPVTQIRWMANYVTKRYGGWRGALEFWHCIGPCKGINKRSTWY